MAIDLAADPLTHQPENFHVGGRKGVLARVRAGKVEGSIDLAARDHRYPEIGFQLEFPVAGVVLPVRLRRMLKADGAVGQDRFTAIGIAKLKHSAGNDGIVRRDALDNLVVVAIDVCKYPDRQPELPAAVFKQGPDPVGKRQIVRRGDFMQGTQCVLGLPALLDFMLECLFCPVALLYFRFQLGVGIR